METVNIKTPYIKLEQFLKLTQICQSGGEAKLLILGGKAKVNNEIEKRRGRKLKDSDIVAIGNSVYIVRKDGGLDGDKKTSP